MRRPKRKYAQGDQTQGKLTVEVCLRFSLRSAGWAGNDRYMFERAWGMLHQIVPLLRFVLTADEEVKIGNVRWRRPGETWQVWQGRQ